MVQAVGGAGVEVGSIVRADEAAPLGRIVPGIAIIQAGIIVVVVATIANRVGVCNGGVAGNGAVALQLYFTIIYARSQEKASQAVTTWEVYIRGY